MTVLGPGGVPLRRPAEPVTYLAWGSAIAAGVVWLASVVTLLVVLVQGAEGGDLLLGTLVQMYLTVFATPVLWIWWRHLLARHRAAGRPEAPQVDDEGSPHLSLNGDVAPPTRW